MKKIFFATTTLAIALLMVGCSNTNEEIKNIPKPSDNSEVAIVEPSTVETQLTDETAYEAIQNYCNEKYGYTPASSSMYLVKEDETDNEYQIKFRSYTGAFVYFYVEKETGVTRMVEKVPDLDIEEEAGTINVFDYLNK